MEQLLTNFSWTSLALWALMLGGVTVVLLLVQGFLAKRYQAKTLALLWSGVALSWLIPIRPTLPHSFQTLFPATKSINSKVSETIGQPAVIDSTPVTFLYAILAVILVVWLLGTAVTVWQLYSQQRKFMRIVARWATPVTDGPVFEQWQAECQKMHVKNNIQIVVVPHVSGPMIVGLRKFKLVIPENYSHIPTQVFRHELAHVIRRDPLLKMLLTTLRALLWWNPFGKIAINQALLNVELACDQKALQHSDQEQRHVYAQFLLQSMQKKPVIPSPAFVASLAGNRDAAKQRLQEILSQKKKRRGVLPAFAVLCVGVSIGIPVSAVSVSEDSGTVNGMSSEISDLSALAEASRTADSNSETKTDEQNNDEVTNADGETDATDNTDLGSDANTESTASDEQVEDTSDANTGEAATESETNTDGDATEAENNSTNNAEQAPVDQGSETNPEDSVGIPENNETGPEGHEWGKKPQRDRPGGGPDGKGPKHGRHGGPRGPQPA